MAEETTAVEATVLAMKPQCGRARKVREGIVVSNKMDKTAVVAVIERVRHPKYAKFVMRTKKLYAHDEANDVNIGDKVRVMETRPTSKMKRWRDHGSAGACQVIQQESRLRALQTTAEPSRCCVSRCSVALAAVTPPSATSSSPP